MRIPRPTRAACKRMAALCGIAVPLVAVLLWSLNAAHGGSLGRSPKLRFAPLFLADAALAAPPEAPAAPSAAPAAETRES